MAKSKRSVDVGVVEVRDALRRRIGDAARTLRDPELADEAIHRARKALKRARGDLRLLRAAVGKKAYSRENAALRDAARPLSAVRDAKVMVETIDALLEDSRSPAQRALLAKLRARLEESRLEARRAIEAARQPAKSAETLDRAWARVQRWRVPGKRPAVLRRGVLRVYSNARKALKDASAEPSAENLHELRKQVKYLRQAMEAFKPDEVREVAKLVKCAEAVADDLGADHDLVVLEEKVSALHTKSSNARNALFGTIASRRNRLQARALRASRKLLDRKPKAFARQLPL